MTKGNTTKKPSYEELKRKGLLSGQIQSFYRREIGGMKRLVGHSMKGQPRKQTWGMHIEK